MAAWARGAARATVDAGAQSVHVHAFDDSGRETLDGTACARVLCAIRVLCPQAPISLTTSAAIVGDPKERFRIVKAGRKCLTLLLQIKANQELWSFVNCCCPVVWASRLDC